MEIPAGLCPHGLAMIRYYGNVFGGYGCGECREADKSRLRLQYEERMRQEAEFDAEYKPVLDKVKELIKDIDEADLHALGLDHVGDWCPPN